MPQGAVSMETATRAALLGSHHPQMTLGTISKLAPSIISSLGTLFLMPGLALAQTPDPFQTAPAAVPRAPTRTRPNIHTAPNTPDAADQLNQQEQGRLKDQTPATGSLFTFQICNQSSGNASAAIMGKAMGDTSYTVRGWYDVSVGACRVIGYFYQGDIYYMAEGEGVNWHGNALDLCVYDIAFTRINAPGYDCSGAERLESFYKWSVNRRPIRGRCRIKKVRSTGPSGFCAVAGRFNIP
jgi:hypothetical protein